MIEAADSIRLLAARLRATVWTIPFYGLWAALGFIHKRDTIMDSSKAITSWTNSLFSGEPGAARDKITALLHLPSD